MFVFTQVPVFLSILEELKIFWFRDSSNVCVATERRFGQIDFAGAK